MLIGAAVVTIQDLFVSDYRGEDEDGRVIGNGAYTGLQPRMLEKARHHNLDRALTRALRGAGRDNQANRSKAA